MTLRVYAKLLDALEQHEEATVILEDALAGKDVENGGGERTRTETVEEAQKVAFLRDSASGGRLATRSATSEPQSTDRGTRRAGFPRC